MTTKMQVRTPYGWRNCIVCGLAPYQGKYGSPQYGKWQQYYFDPLPEIDPRTGIMPSTGGTHYAFRERG